MIEIPLTKGYVAIVDDEDADLAQHSWNSNPSRSGKIVYAQRTVYVFDGQKRKHTTVSLHRMVMERVLGRSLTKSDLIDHVHGIGIDCRRKELRLCSRSQNSWNSGKRPNNTTGYKGVSYTERYKHPYIAYFRYLGKRITIGRFDTVEEAYAAYCETVKQYHGEFFRAA